MRDIAVGEADRGIDFGFEDAMEDWDLGKNLLLLLSYSMCFVVVVRLTVAVFALSQIDL